MKAIETSRMPTWLIDEGLFCCWKWEERNGKRTKVPYDPKTGRRAKANDPSTFATLREALEASVGYDGIGVGFFGELCGIDLDHVLDGDGEPNELAQDVLQAMDGAYVERSPSGDGIHVLFRSSAASWFGGADAYKERYYMKRGCIEVYVAGMTSRYFTVTGDAIHSETEQGDFLFKLLGVLDSHMVRAASPKAKPLHDSAREATFRMDDDEIIGIAMGASNGGKFRRLWEGGWEGAYPSHNEADLALCVMLAFWTQCDESRIDFLFRRSGLYQEKWEREDYRRATITKAVATVGTECYHPKPHVVVRAPEASDTPRQPMRSLNSSQVNDRELAELFASVTKDVRYVAELRRFAVFNGRYWQIEGGNEPVARRVKDFIAMLERIAGKNLAKLSDVDITKATPEAEQKKELQRLYAALCQYDAHNKRTHLVRDVASDRGILSPTSAFDRKRHLLNVANGTLDLTGDPMFRKHDPADMITRMAPVVYDPEAKCPTFMATVAGVFEGDVELMRFLQKWFGIIVAGITALDKFLLAGLATRAGKDTVFGTLGEMLGWDERSGYACVASPDSLAVRSFANGHGPSSDVARWQGKRLILTSEFSESITLDAELLKRLSGGVTPITARRMRENEVSFLIDGTVVMLANVWPDVRDKTLFDGDRPMCLPFERHLEEWERDTTLRTRLRDPEELSGILNWAIEGLVAFRNEGLGPILDAVRDMGARFRMQSDAGMRVVAEFVQAHLVPEKGGHTTVSAMYDLFRRSCASGAVPGPREFSGRVTAFVPVLPRATVANGTKPRQLVLGYRLVE